MAMKVAVVTNSIPHYRVPLYSALGKWVSLDVLHSGKLVEEAKGFRQQRYVARRWGPFFLQKGLSTHEFQYDAIVYMCDIRWLSIMYSFLRNRHSTTSVLWGAWSTKKFIPDMLRLYMARLAESNIFYCERHKEEFLRLGLDSGKCFVANNTLEIENSIDTSSYNKPCSILHVGTLDKRKRLDLVLDALSLLKASQIRVNFDIVGDGEERMELQYHAERLGIADQVKFYGRIENDSQLLAIYSNNMASISPGQAGLSVLQSMAYGVPFITFSESVTGGERDNIMDGKNGLLLNSLSAIEIRDMLASLHETPDIFREYGREAYSHYHSQATIQMMVSKFLSAIGMR